MQGDPCVARLNGVGWVLDPDRGSYGPHSSHLPRHSFHLSAPHIKPLLQDESGEAATHDRKRRKRWAAHADATDQDLVAKLAAAHKALMGLESSKSFFSAEEPRACCALARVPVDPAPLPVPQDEDDVRAGGLGSKSADEDLNEEPLSLDPRKESRVTRGRLTVCATRGSAPCTLAGESYVVPPSSAFFLGDAAQGLRQLRIQYDLVVCDPPWPSKSRGKYYKTMTVQDLCSLPVGNCLNQGGVLALWVTNDRKLVEAAQSEILPAWGLQAVETWFWLKVTCKGQLSSPLESPHKKPFERVIIARQRGSGTGGKHELAGCPTHDTQVIVSQPAQHSRKPFLDPLLRPLVIPARESGGGEPPPPDCPWGRGLEIFARELHEGWTSVGDECLLFQNTRHLQQAAFFKSNSKDH